ncbi:hypothetical protein LOTGIDRAFT_133377 [Lottia gigantea]|uniref:Phosphatidylethanolamine N-methyltransferase n=1 Tax=Lottia gigantea TaxID=225164 RepID=V3ZH29_LOTGI|nr:hypothetical protein LOTGIDRAFT_133377 [Lottia gigantea]ESO83462.1 hypothetical protein LOTGIDRAFT_133377 [Lottia gigantea]
MDAIINLKDVNLLIASGCIIFNPLYWNIVARWECRSRAISRKLGAKVGCSLLAATILVLGIVRDWRFGEAIVTQPRWHVMEQQWIWALGYVTVSMGTILVLSSFLRLGFFGTFLGDYFGILMDERVIGFPFNIINNPMYWGTSLNFLGYAVVQASPVGIILSALVAIVYKIAIIYEGEFTTRIYNEADKNRKMV